MPTAPMSRSPRDRAGVCTTCRRHAIHVTPVQRNTQTSSSRNTNAAIVRFQPRASGEIGTLKPEDIREGHIVVVDPAPIPADEMQRTYDWVKSWGMLEETESPLQLVNIKVQTQAHVAAE